MGKVLSWMLLGLLGCGGSTPPSSEGNPTTLVLQYSDFGPQVAARAVLGVAWWQWQPHGDPDPETAYDIRVVVYRGVSKDEISARFPVEPQTNKDFRYLTLKDALAYLDDTIAEDVHPPTTALLQKTRARLRSRFALP